MPRSNRPRRPSGRRGRAVPNDEDLDPIERLRAGWRRTEHRRGRSYVVQPIAAASAKKPYTCPGCGQEVGTGVAHVVVWREDGVLGDHAAIEDRRHWHTHCWRIG